MSETKPFFQKFKEAITLTDPTVKLARRNADMIYGNETDLLRMSPEDQLGTYKILQNNIIEVLRTIKQRSKAIKNVEFGLKNKNLTSSNKEISVHRIEGEEKDQLQHQEYLIELIKKLGLYESYFKKHEVDFQRFPELKNFKTN